jgi:hypothetical protein
MRSTERTVPGLKALRKGSGKTPTFNCPNCRKARYTTCGCLRRGERRPVGRHQEAK